MSGDLTHSFSELLYFMQSLARMPPHLPLAQAWFRATAVGSASPGEPQLGQDAESSMDLAAVAATLWNLQTKQTI